MFIGSVRRVWLCILINGDVCQSVSP